MKKYIYSSAMAFLLILAGIGTPSRAENVKSQDFFILKSAETAATTMMAAYYDPSGTFQSQIYESKFPFDLLGLTWSEDLPAGTAAEMEIRFRDKSGIWSEWQDLEEDVDGAQDEEGKHTYVMTNQSLAFQYRAELSTANRYYSPRLADFSFDYVAGGKTSFFTKFAKLVFTKDEQVVERKSWGADESLRLSKTASASKIALAEEDSSANDKSDNSDSSSSDDPDMEIIKEVDTDADGNPLLWPLEYPKKIKKIIVHHTASSSNLDDPEASLRAIYYYHSVTRGWGDIGYNFIVDQNGKVYEGRYGGNGVVGGHAYGYNTGSVGIALLGNFENEELPAEMMKSLTGLIYEKAQLNGIDPDTSGTFRGKVMPNVMGHRDVGKTACPGEFAYDYLPDIRKVVGEAMDKRRHTNLKTDFAYEEVGERELLTLDPQSSAEVIIKLKNTGTATWNSATYLKSSTSEILKVGTAKMQESSVAPGETGTFTFKLSSALYGGLENFDVNPVFNGTEKVLTYLDLAAFVERPLMKFSTTSAKADTSLLKPGKSSTVSVSLKNTGNLSWKNSGENAVYLKQTGSTSPLAAEKLATLSESSVAPGGTGTFEFEVNAPTSASGKYTIYFAPQMDNSNALVNSSGSVSIQVAPTSDDASIVDATSNLTFAPGEKKSAWIQITNYSDKTWKSSGSLNKVSLGFTKNLNIKLGEARLAVSSLAPGSTSKISFSITAPTKAGNYTIYVRPRLGSKNLTSQAYTLKITVKSDSSSSETSYKADYENPIRIKLTPDSEIEPILSSTSAFSVFDNSTLLKTFTANSRVRVSESGEKFAVTSGSYSWEVAGPVRFTPKSGAIMQITNMDQRPAWNPSLNDNLFRGTMEVRNVDDELTLINELALEDYVKGIAEVSNGDPTEKIKTLTVIARTYAYYYITQAEKFAGKPYNLDDDPNTSQKYIGYGFETRSPNVSAAATATVGKVVTYNSKPVITPYFTATDGTETKSAETVWGWTNTPWLLSVSDSLCTTSSTFLGHGVGLSGCGATAMAKAGKTFEEIIRYYYTGVEIQKI